METKARAPRNRTITLAKPEHRFYRERLGHLASPVTLDQIVDRTICGDLLEAAPLLPREFVDLMFVDPPYNRGKAYNGVRFPKLSTGAYAAWTEKWISALLHVLKPTASVYICSDWRSSGVVQAVVERFLVVQNRITWEREKGRGAQKNWKNCSEDIWFCTVSRRYTFNSNAVKTRRRVIAPYTHANGAPKDWRPTAEGGFRDTFPSNLWNDLTVPFWSMPENTDHPTQKPEKLLAKVILASSAPGDVVLDPFLGSGTTSVVAKKLGRRFVGIELDETYCCLAEKRLALADSDPSIQGYHDGVFWERNSLAGRAKRNSGCRRFPSAPHEDSLFGFES